MDASIILEVTRTLIGETEPCGDSGIDRERMKNLEALIYVVDELLYDVEKTAVNKDRREGSMRVMGEKAYKAFDGWYSWIDEYLINDEHDDADGLQNVHEDIGESNEVFS